MDGWSVRLVDEQDGRDWCTDPFNSDVFACACCCSFYQSRQAAIENRLRALTLMIEEVGAAQVSTCVSPSFRHPCMYMHNLTYAPSIFYQKGTLGLEVMRQWDAHASAIAAADPATNFGHPGIKVIGRVCVLAVG